MTSKHFLFLALFPLAGQAQVAGTIDTWKSDADLKNASIGFCVLNAENSEIVSEYNSHQLLTPASTLKIVTTSAALGLLGANFRYETRIYYSGAFDKKTGILDGDLIIVGSGDPTLQSENFVKDNASITDKWAAQLKEKGIKEIKGGIVGDGSCFKRLIPSNWIWEDISNYYGAVPCGLSYMDNKFKVLFTTEEEGRDARLTYYTPRYMHNEISFTTNVTANGTKDEAYAYGDPFSFSKEIHGTIPPNKTDYEIEVALPDPALLCAEHLMISLSKLGINCGSSYAVNSNYRKGNLPGAGQLLITHYSPTLDKIVYFTNMKSNNLYCETLLRTLGKGNAEAGLKVVVNYWSKRGLDSNEIYMTDASGLARIDAITANYEASLLGKMYRDSSNYKTFNNSLPVAGKQGSMSSIGKGTSIESNLRAKTGYLTRTRAYCGYVKTRSGKNLAFSLILNNYNCSAYEAKLKVEKFLVALSDL